MADTKKYYHNIDADGNKILNPLLNPLTTAQRLALTLGVGDAGYISFDTTLNQLYLWTGSTWISAAGTALWGGITGLITNQTDLITYLSTNYTPQSRNLTINGTTYDLSADRTWTINSLPSQTGNAGKWLTTDGINPSWANLPPSVTSVGLSMPSAFTVTNSPITSSGTLTVTGAGLVSQYVRGDGTLADFPGSTGGGSSVSYYLNGSINQGTFGGNTYYQMSKTPVIGAGTNFSIAANGYIAQFLTDAGDPSLLNIPSGSWNIQFYMNANSAGGSPNFYVELYKYDGVSFTLISSNSTSPESITGGTSVDLYYTSIAVPTTVLTVTDRLAIRVYVNNSGKTITLRTEGTTLAQIVTTFSTGLTALNGLTAQVQYLTTGTSGTDFNISSATNTHTFNIPVASATNTGKLSSSDWSTFNNKQDVLSLTTTGSSGAATLIGTVLNIPNYTLSGLGGVPTSRTLTINGTAFDLSTNRSWSVGTVTSVAALTIGTSGTDLNSSVATGTTTPVITLNVPTASATDRGALSSSDWSTFNSKQNAITLTTTGNSGSATFVSNTLNIPTYTLAGLGGQPSNSNLTGLSGLTYASGTPFVKMTAAGTFALDTNTYLTGNQTITLSGDITGSGSTSITTAIGNNKVTNAMLSQVATATFKGRTTAGTGNVEDLTQAQATALLNQFTSVLQGVVPASGGGTTNFLRADGTWATPPGGGSGITSLNGLTGATQTFATGTTGTDFNISSVGTTHTFNIPTASAINRGALSSTDWNTFNNKVDTELSIVHALIFG